MTHRATWAAGLCLTMLVASGTLGDDEQEAEASKRYQAHAKETAAKYDIQTAGDQPRHLKLREESLLRWTNPLGANKAHGEVFLCAG